MTPDPVFDKLARFTPDASGLDPADILFRAGRASARTPWAWKAAAAVLLVSNVLFFLNRSKPSEIVYVHTPPPESPAPPETPPVESSPWNPHALIGALDPDRTARPEAVADLAPARAALTPLSARRMDID